MYTLEMFKYFSEVFIFPLSHVLIYRWSNERDIVCKFHTEKVQLSLAQPLKKLTSYFESRTILNHFLIVTII